MFRFHLWFQQCSVQNFWARHSPSEVDSDNLISIFDRIEELNHFVVNNRRSEFKFDVSFTWRCIKLNCCKCSSSTCDSNSVLSSNFITWINWAYFEVAYFEVSYIIMLTFLSLKVTYVYTVHDLIFFNIY